MFRTLLAALALGLLPGASLASSVVFEATPNETAGGFDIVAGAGSSLPADSSPFVGNIFGGEGFAISGVENFTGTLADGGKMTSLRFEVYEPTSTQKLEGCNFTCVDSQFTLQLFNDGTEVFSAAFFPADDVVNGVQVAPGFHVFDTFVVTETVGGIDNEFFANFSATKLAPVPLPASGLLLLGGLALMRRLRRSHRG